jgi:hypothetical protein
VNQILAVSEPELRVLGPLTPGSAVPLSLTVQGDAGRPYVVAAAMAATPPLLLPDGRSLGIGIDALTLYSLAPGNPYFQDFTGSLSAAAAAAPSLVLPAGPSLSGLALRLAAVTLDPVYPSSIRTVLRPITLSFP